MISEIPCTLRSCRGPAFSTVVSSMDGDVGSWVSVSVFCVISLPLGFGFR